VQTELVDHLANGIETQWQSNPDLHFDDALQLEFKKFGVIGFNDVIEQKMTALNKRYWLLIWSYFKAFFKLPKIIVTLFLIWSYYQLLITTPYKMWFVGVSVFFLLAIPIYKIYNHSKRIRQIKEQTNKKWLFDNTALQLGGIIQFLGVFVQVAFFNNGAFFSAKFSLIFSVVIILFALVVYIALYIASPKLRKTMAKQYPDYKFV
jgi:hypothetical protein